MLTDTITALATPPGPSALAIVRLSGPQAISIADRIFRPKGRLANLPSHRCAVGEVVGADGPIDHVVATVFRHPRTFTGEDAVEITCHGGPLIVTRILAALEACGARPAREGEFSLRAFLNGKLDLAQAEAISALIQARSAAGAQAALRILAGGLRRALDETLGALTGALAEIEGTLDVQEDGAADVVLPAGLPRGDRVGDVLAGERARLEALLAGSRTGRLLEEGLRVALVGKPNAGKSSLFNAFLSRDRAIVSPEPGTTRDTLEGWVTWTGFPVALIDTAGLGDARTSVEREGVRRAREAIAAASLVVLVLDVSQERPDELEAAVEALGVEDTRVVVALHKWDLDPVDAWRAAVGDGRVPSSALDAPGVETLREAVIARLTGGVGDPEATLVVGERQRHLLHGACAAISRAGTLWVQGAGGELVAYEMRTGMDRIGEVLGRRVGPMVLEEIFSRFCVGK